MTLAATFLGGARSRLLPASIPFRFFGAAVAFQVAAWAVLLATAAGVPDFAGGPGPVLAALHLVTLGVLAMTAMGAAYQLLPVATRQPLSSVWPARLSFWLFAPGVAVLAYGMATYHVPWMAVGGVLASAGLLILAALMAANLRRAKDLPVMIAHAWVAVICLVALVGLGLALAADFHHGFLPNHRAAATTHLILASYGFMGMLVLGFSQVLVPMFTLSPAPPKGWSRAAFILGTVALAAGAVGAFAGIARLIDVAVLLGLGAAGSHLMAMQTVMRKRMRRHLGLSFLMVRVAWTLLPLSILLGGLAALDVLGPRGGTLFGFVLVVGWLLTFLLGILQRILPFLGSMHAARGSGQPPLASSLTAVLPLRISAAGHLAAVVVVAGGIAMESGWLVRVGAGAGLLGALAFAAFAANIVRRIAGTGATQGTER